MDLHYFLLERINFIRFFYSTGSQPFSNILNAIENEEEPYANPEYSEDREHAFFDEWIDARTGIYSIGYAAISMLSATLKLFTSEWKKQYEHYNRIDFTIDSSIKGYFPKFVNYLENCGYDFSNCPVNLEFLEQIVITRNGIQHPKEITTLYAKFTDKDIKNYSRLSFRDPSETLKEENSWFGLPDIKPSDKDIYSALEQVALFSSWIESFKSTIHG